MLQASLSPPKAVGTAHWVLATPTPAHNLVVRRRPLLGRLKVILRGVSSRTTVKGAVKVQPIAGL